MTCDVLTNVINEGSTAQVTATFRDVDGNSVQPDAIRWKLNDVTTGQELQPWVFATPGNPTLIRIDRALLDIIDIGQPYEQKQVTVEGSSNAGLDIASDEIVLNIKNLGYYP